MLLGRLMNWNSLELVRQISEEDDISGGRYFVVASQEAMVSMRDWGNYQQCRVCHEVSAAGCLSESHAPPVSQGKIPNNRSQLICPLVSILRPEHFLWCESANDGLLSDYCPMSKLLKHQPQLRVGGLVSTILLSQGVRMVQTPICGKKCHSVRGSDPPHDTTVHCGESPTPAPA